MTGRGEGPREREDEGKRVILASMSTLRSLSRGFARFVVSGLKYDKNEPRKPKEVMGRRAVRAADARPQVAVEHKTRQRRARATKKEGQEEE